MNGRLFDPTLGRFLQVDPLMQDDTALQNFNRYAYCFNNPLTCTDPTGLAGKVDDQTPKIGQDGVPGGSVQTVLVNGGPTPLIQTPYTPYVPISSGSSSLSVEATASGIVAVTQTVVIKGSKIGSVGASLAKWGLRGLGIIVCAGGGSCPIGVGLILMTWPGNMTSSGADSPEIKPSDVAGKSPGEIDQLATEAGLKPKGPDPKNGKGAYVDPVTGEQRVLVHGDHAHVNDSAGNRLDINGNRVPSNSPEAHLPVKQ